MNWQVKIAKDAEKNIKRFPLKDRLRIQNILEELLFNPYGGDIEKMEGSDNSWRRRTGSYRVFYDLDKKNKIIEVTNIERRTSGTY